MNHCGGEKKEIRGLDAVPEACNKQGATIVIFLLECLLAGGVGTLPVEALVDASKMQGGTIAIF